MAYDSYTGGWRCSVCGQWVESGFYHVCPKQGSYFTSNYSFVQDYTALLERLVVALERIADRLDKEE